ncbi:dymeclin isoform X1 [Lycorma delicatula]|uniref:dymeclin isoform X1 n=1 Tax=Lycorma delicatula TaxID=130591 RepID=UPI003F5132F7
MGTSSSQHANSSRPTNEFLLQFVGEEYISPDDQFWNSFLSFTLKPPASIEDDKKQDEKLKLYCEKLLLNNSKTGNLRSLLCVFRMRSTELLVSSQIGNTVFSWHAYNALFVIRCYVKFLVQRIRDPELVSHIESLGGNKGKKDAEGPILSPFLESVIDLIVHVPVKDATYSLHYEAINNLLVLLSVQLFTTQNASHLQIYRWVMESNQAEGLIRSLVLCYIEQMKPPPSSGGSLLIGLASDLWNLLTLSSGTDNSDGSPLANQSVLLLLVLINHCTAERNPYREALSSYSDNLSNLFITICQTLKKEETTLLLYHLLHRNSHFKTYLLARSDIELLVLPMLQTIYNAPDNNCHHMYMSLIILLILTEDQLFNKTVHSTMLKGVSWYTERVIPEISLGGLMILITARTVQYNLLKMRDKYLHTNCLAALANMSSQFSDLHPYVCQRLIGLFEVLARTHARANHEMSAVEEALRILLEVINSCLTHQLLHNTDLVYTLLYKQHIFEPFRSHPAFQDIVQNIDMVIEYFTSRLAKAENQSGDVEQVLGLVKHAALQWPHDRLKKFPELKFKYVEEEKPEEFFIPYVWSLVTLHCNLYWDSSLIKQC